MQRDSLHALRSAEDELNVDMLCLLLFELLFRAFRNVTFSTDPTFLSHSQSPP